MHIAKTTLLITRPDINPVTEKAQVVKYAYQSQTLTTIQAVSGDYFIK